MMPLVDVGATVLGGCCGTTPQHIQKLVSRLKEKKAREIPERKSIRALTTERNITPISLDGRFRIVGERINPTGKKELQEKLRAGDLSLVMDMAEEQEKEAEKEKKKEAKKDTKLVSYEMFRQGMNIDEIAKARDLVSGTIAGHLEHYVRSGKIKVEQVVKAENIAKIRKYLDEHEYMGIFAIKVALGDAVSYADIKFVLAVSGH